MLNFHQSNTITLTSSRNWCPIPNTHLPWSPTSWEAAGNKTQLFGRWWERYQCKWGREMMRRKSFRKKGLRHKKSHCNISIRGWSRERMGKSIRPCLCFLYLSGITPEQVLWVVSQSSGETGGFLHHPVKHTAAHRIRFLEKIKLQHTYNFPRKRHCQEWGSQHFCRQQAYLVLVNFLREVCN